MNIVRISVYYFPPSFFFFIFSKLDFSVEKKIIVYIVKQYCRNEVFLQTYAIIIIFNQLLNIYLINNLLHKIVTLNKEILSN